MLTFVLLIDSHLLFELLQTFFESLSMVSSEWWNTPTTKNTIIELGSLQSQHSRRTFNQFFYIGGKLEFVCLQNGYQVQTEWTPNAWNTLHSHSTFGLTTGGQTYWLGT